MENLTVGQQLMVLFGQLCLFVCVGAALLAAGGWIKYEIGYLKRRYQHKHRFDKPPTAECYCVGCDNWHVNSTDGTTGICMSGHCRGSYTADSFFCKYAKKRSKEEDRNDLERKETLKQYDNMDI